MSPSAELNYRARYLDGVLRNSALEARVVALEAENARLRECKAQHIDMVAELTALRDSNRRLARRLASCPSCSSSFEDDLRNGAIRDPVGEQVPGLREAHDLVIASSTAIWRLAAKLELMRAPSAKRAVVSADEDWHRYANQAPAPTVVRKDDVDLEADAGLPDLQPDAAVLEGWQKCAVRPRLVFVGAQKTGSNLIYGALAAHKDVVIAPKDCGWFGSQWNYGPMVVDGVAVPRVLIKDYIRHGIPSTSCVVDMTSDYLFNEQALKNIREYGGDTVKIVVVLRQPVEYAFSLYNNGLRHADWDTSFFDWVDGDYTKWSFGYTLFPDLFEALATIYSLFPRENILVLNYEKDIVKNPIATARKVVSFADLNSVEFDVRIENVGYHPRFLFNRLNHIFVNGDAGNYIIPSNTLVRCSGVSDPASVKIWTEPDDSVVSSAFQLQSKWTQEISGAVYQDLFDSRCRGMTEKIVANFGLSLEHWFHSARALRYKDAPPPPVFRIT